MLFLRKELTKQQEKYNELHEKYVKLQEKMDKVEEDFKQKKAWAYKTMDLEFKDKMARQKQELEELRRQEIESLKNEYETKRKVELEENFRTFKEQLSKIHTEGNQNTKYLEKMSIEIMKSFSNAHKNVAIGYTKGK